MHPLVDKYLVLWLFQHHLPCCHCWRAGWVRWAINLDGPKRLYRRPVECMQLSVGVFRRVSVGKLVAFWIQDPRGNVWIGKQHGISNAWCRIFKMIFILISSKRGSTKGHLEIHQVVDSRQDSQRCCWLILGPWAHEATGPFPRKKKSGHPKKFPQMRDGDFSGCPFFAGGCCHRSWIWLLPQFFQMPFRLLAFGLFDGYSLESHSRGEAVFFVGGGNSKVYFWGINRLAHPQFDFQMGGPGGKRI